MALDEWARRHNISLAAMSELYEIFGASELTPNLEPILQEKTEGDVSINCRIAITRVGGRLFRNNVGAYSEKNPPSPGTRWGLMNDSARINKQIKSSDLIGIRPIIIGPHHIGQKIGQFMAIEVKKPNWKYKDTDREQAQLRFIKLITSLGGYAKFVNSSGGI